MELIGWVFWVLALLWTGVSLVSFLVDVFNPNPFVQPMGAVFSTNIKRAVGFTYVLGMSTALWGTATLGVSKLHLLWFVPVFHLFGAIWIPMLFSGVHTPTRGPQVPTKDYLGPESSLKAYPLLYAYFDHFAELAEMARSGHLQIALHDNNPRSNAYTPEQVLADKDLFLRLYGDNLLRVRLPDGFKMFRSVEKDYWDRASHPEEYSYEISSADADLNERMRGLLEQIDVHVSAIRTRYGLG